MPPKIAAIGWYREDDYQNVIKVSDDGDVFDPVYANWLKVAERAFENIEKMPGVIPLKVYIHSKTFPIWCDANGMEVDAKARIAYGNHMAFDHAKKLGLV